MKRAISNPNRVHHTMYILIIAISVVALIISITVPTFSCKLLEVILEVLKNLSYGCVASTLVAWRIDYVNVKKANQKAKYSPSSKKQAFSNLISNILTTILGVVLLRSLWWIIPIGPILGLTATIKGISGVIKSISYLISPNKSK